LGKVVFTKREGRLYLNKKNPQVLAYSRADFKVSHKAKLQGEGTIILDCKYITKPNQVYTFLYTPKKQNPVMLYITGF